MTLSDQGASPTMKTAADYETWIRPRLAAMENALREAEKGYGSLLWALNNAHNAHTAMWKQIANAAELDARAALVAIRSALDEKEGG